MLEHSIRLVGLLCVGLAAGIALCVLFLQRNWTGTGQAYAELMQLSIRALTVPAPALGALGLVAMTIDSALLFKRGGGAAAWLSAAAALLGLAAMALTKFGHFPINDQILRWDPARPPADWTSVQARWSALHLGRTISGTASFALYLPGNLLRS